MLIVVWDCKLQMQNSTLESLAINIKRIMDKYKTEKSIAINASMQKFVSEEGNGIRSVQKGFTF